MIPLGTQKKKKSTDFLTRELHVFFGTGRLETNLLVTILTYVKI